MPTSDLLKTPKLGFGCMRLPLTNPDDPKSIDIPHVEKMVDAFIAGGGTYFDTAYTYHEQTSEAAMRKALVERYPRESYTMATKVLARISPTAEDAKRCLFTSLERLGLDYLDFYLLHNLGASRTALYDEYALWDWAEEQKQAGTIKHWGFSLHDGADTLEQLLTQHPTVDFVQLQVNYLDWENPITQSRRCMEVAAAHNVPVVIMEPARGGRLAQLPQRAQAVLAQADPHRSAVSWAYQFCFALPNVVTVLSGMSSLQQVQENIASWHAATPPTPKEQATLAQALEALQSVGLIPCTNCRYCVKDCPQGVKIPEILGIMNLEKMTESQSFAKAQYSWQTTGGRASSCIQCGLCESTCPQSIDIINQLEQAAEAYE